MTRTAEDLAFRLATVQRAFPRALDLGSPHSGIAEILASPERFVVRAAPFVSAHSGEILVADEEFLPFA